MKSIRKYLAVQLASAVLLVTATSAGYAAGNEPSQPSVVVKVDSGGFHWLDAAVGSVATLAAGLLVFGLMLTLRAERRRA